MAFRILLLAALGGVVARAAQTFHRFEVAEHSMEPALSAGDFVITSRRLDVLGVGDIVVFEHPFDDGFWLVKRVVGVAGDLITIGDRTLTRNGVTLDENTPGSGSWTRAHPAPCSSSATSGLPQLGTAGSWGRSRSAASRVTSSPATGPRGRSASPDHHHRPAPPAGRSRGPGARCTWGDPVGYRSVLSGAAPRRAHRGTPLNPTVGSLTSTGSMRVILSHTLHSARRLFP